MAGPKIYIIGGPGSGKTTLAINLSARTGATYFDMDQYAWNSPPIGGLKSELDLATVVAEVKSEEGWVAEGIYHGWTDDLIDSADLVVWLDPPWLVAVWRDFVRHVRAEIRRDNRHPGWRQLVKFLWWTRRYYVASVEQTAADQSWSRATTEPYAVRLGERMMRTLRTSAVEVLARLEAEDRRG